ncbi:ATPase AAA [Haloferax larsenii JCM 13917]|nr:hypothetical protein [Haloferax larsenii]ELZ78645.1 ATPase AAA [Haloferax larsenii JCM 13917]
MKISDFDIGHFAKDEYGGIAESGIDGENFLISGQNRTGKTLSLNAILYNLLGSSYTIDLATGRGNKVELGFTDGSKFYRGVPEAVFDTGSDELTASNAKSRFKEHLCSEVSSDISVEDLIKCHFLHTHTNQLPLSTLSKEDRLALIRAVTDLDSQQDLEFHQRAKEQLSEEIGQLTSEASALETDLKDVRNERSSARNQLKKYEKLGDLIEEGKLKEINSKLAEEVSIREDLSEVFREQEGLRQEQRTLKKEKSRWQRYHSAEIVEVIADAVFDFVCPVCEERIDPEKAENRVRQGYCPFCGEKHSLTELKENIGKRIDVSNDRVDEILNRLDEIQERLEGLGEKEAELKSGIPEIEQVDRFVERKLRQNGYQIDGIESKTEEEIKKHRVAVEQAEQQVEQLENRIEVIDNRKRKLTQYRQQASEEIVKLSETSREDISSFESRWEDHYEEVADELSLNIRVSEDGDIVLPGNTGDRYYGEEGDLSDAETQLLNVSFAVTLNEFAREANLTDWNVIVLDEPFTSLDEDGQDSLLEFLNKQEKQFIVTSSDESYQSEFEKQVRLRRETIQATFVRFN